MGEAMGVGEEDEGQGGEKGAAEEKGAAATEGVLAGVGEISDKGLDDETGEGSCQPGYGQKWGGETEVKEVGGAEVDLGRVAKGDTGHGTGCEEQRLWWGGHGGKGGWGDGGRGEERVERGWQFGGGGGGG
eukprot:GFKZ01007887.1.p2 GENE.GFKZ01007887.1~~GFKZ01007887.1.p2  ORF type:complete len:131 (+),score=25.39 GFKZ01007887.1:48-440(+)